jgi:glycosyltransferase involved in cell wall biosynthesis
VRTSVIIATYNAPRELDLALHGIERQTTPPDEVLIADDGSTGETRELVARWRERMTVPLQHVWQADDGFRKCRILNEAVRRSAGEQVVFLDGDSIPHQKWIADHRRAFRARRVLCGRRVRLGPALSRRLTAEDVAAGRLEKPLGMVLRSGLARDSKRVLLGMRLPQGVARLFHPGSRRLMGVNYSLPRADSRITTSSCACGAPAGRSTRCSTAPWSIISTIP